jgi:hypothetical protein
LRVRTKRKVAVAALAALFVWPLVHRVLVATLGIDPWRFFGFAMYCVPKPRVAVGLYTVEDGRRKNLVLAEDSRARGVIEAFIVSREAWGRRYRPDVLAPPLVRALKVDDLEILVREHRLDPSSARIVREEFAYHYDRSGRAVTARRVEPSRPGSIVDAARGRAE